MTISCLSALVHAVIICTSNNNENENKFLFISEILRMKKPFLPKSLLNFNRKVRRKLRKKKSKMKQDDYLDPLVADNSDDEKLIYARVFDF